MIEKVAFASCYVYSPAGTGLTCERSRLLRSLLKEGDAAFMAKYAMRVREQAQSRASLAGFFLGSDILVPVPCCRPKTRGTWVAAELAKALVHAGIGSATWPGLRRICAVRKSATAAHGARPAVDLHYRSFEFEPPAFRVGSVMLIDDVITCGRTLLAAATRVREAFPEAPVRAFALVRTMGLCPRVERLLAPCQGEIRWNGGDAHRVP